MSESEELTPNPETSDSKGDSSASKGAAEISSTLEFLRSYDAFWKSKLDGIYDKKIELENPLINRINHIRQAIRFYLIPVVQNTQLLEGELQTRNVKHLPAIFSEKKREKFFQHFYGVIPDEEQQWLFEDRDPFKIDEIVLYDLYKIKRTMNGITALLKELANKNYVIPSVFKESEQVEILKGMNSALFMAFKFSIKPKYQVELFKSINLGLLSPDQIEKRRAEDLVYTRLKDLESSPFRRILLHLLFRNQIKTNIKDKETTIDYNLVDFEQFLEDYFGYFLEDSAEQVEYMQTYHLFHIGGNSFKNSIVEDPNPESLLFEEIDEIKTYI